MYDETASFQIGNTPVFLYGLWVMLGAMALLLVFAWNAKKRALPQGASALYGALALPLGLICSRLLFCLLDFRFHDIFSLRAAAMFWGGGYSMIGALLGAALAGWLTARITKAQPLRVLDALTPALLAFILFARLGEGATELLGRSRTLTWEALANSPLAYNDGYDGYLRTYLLEAATAAALFCILQRALYREKKPGQVLFTGMLLLGCTQILWESLRFDSHMRYGFVSMQMILFACMFAAPLILFAARCGKKAMIAAIALVIFAAGGAVGLEFMIDRSDVNNIIVYLLYIVLLALPIAAGLHWKKRSEKA